jgi:ubiquinone biosynthesis protein UbiJ
MQSLNNDERKEVLGETLADELRAILEYVHEVPAMAQEIHQVRATTEDTNHRLRVLEQVVKVHESDIRNPK